MPRKITDTVTAAVVTGGHNYQVIEFRKLFQNLDGVDAYVQHIEDFAWSTEAERDAYDVVVFYFMPTGVPSDDQHPFHGAKPKSTWEHLGTANQGLVLLHHAVLAYPEWPFWKGIAGIEMRDFDYHHDEELTVAVADPDHPVTQGLDTWTMIDETYEMNEPEDDCHVILTTSHPKSLRSIAWTRRYRNSPVFSFVCGHDDQTWQNASFRQVLTRGIHWAAREAGRTEEKTTA